MIEWLTAPFEPAFMQRALVAGLIAAVATAVVGTWVVLRGLAFLGDALAHGIIPGVAAATIWGVSPVLGALVAAVVMGGAVTLVTTRARIREDTGIGLLFVGMLALGVIIISTSTNFATNATNVLFGDVLGVATRDLVVQGLATGAIVVLVALLYRPLLALTFNRDKAATLGMHPTLAHALLLVLLAVSIVVSFQTIGTLLVFGLLIGPPATASLVARRVPTIMALGVLIGSACVVVGLAVSFHAGTAGGATIAALAVATFFVTLVVTEVTAVVRRSSVLSAGQPV